MLPAHILNALQSLANASKPAPLSLESRPPSPVTRLEPGQLLQGSIQAKLPEGFFKVEVAGQMMQMRLPANMQAGDTVRLQVISTNPRITFSVAPSTTPLSTPDQIGPAARMLSDLADTPLERPVVQQLGDKAIWGTTQQPPNVTQLAAGLRDALSKSGLFYESHQAEWVRGERSITQLLEEPQNQLTGKSIAHMTAAMVATIPEKNQSPVPQPAPTASPPTLKTDGDAALPIAKDLLPLVQQQLHTLENHHMVWSGQIWPGQQMQWQIQGEPEHRGRTPHERQWSTEMDLSLPKLGDVSARIIFTERGVRLSLHAADASTSALFNQNLPRLREALDNAGISLLGASVRDEANE